MAIPQLKDKQVLITGAASGIGRAAALAFARQGAHIIASDLRLEPLQSLQQEVQALGVNCLLQAVDVSDEAAMAAFAAWVHEQVGAPDVLFNNAGIAYLGKFLDSGLEQWQRVLNVNLMGVVHGCYHFIPLMLAAGGPRQVVNVSSTASYAPSPSMASYAASKFAVAGFCDVLRMELAGTRIGVTDVCPGVINTAITASGAAPSMQGEQLQRLQAYYRKEGCLPEVVANDVVQAVITGKTLVLTGPYSRLLYHLKRLSRRLLFKITLGTAAKVGYL
ncbi:SDR family NAD(P)-dependent oxidoreductase [Pseudomonas sp. N040]|uniref:SDR family NAD(P)-dependent oxidoreductase n=1 Tax=Pseudomonas sp. N040 TaxID=2785325 RepID=UPI0018A252D7|nr:SDR family NAD(P)-dependent oxidoreductase [Pseudomonas sp. N040]MBF7729400.1 SDR family NAD(P)-dependent oxidoreductase [Pseudomonas sp. N040]MBW7013040.1 SDR family NAD(P)-dependent oxidoreductase [Pseudomonas sp. N040]